MRKNQSEKTTGQVTYAGTENPITINMKTMTSATHNTWIIRGVLRHILRTGFMKIVGPDLGV